MKVLRKIGTLTGEERELIKSHPSRGVELIEPLGGKVVQILPYILYHMNSMTEAAIIG